MRVCFMLRAACLVLTASLLFNACTDEAGTQNTNGSKALQEDMEDCEDAELDIDAIVAAMQDAGFWAFPDDGTPITLENLQALSGEGEPCAIISEENGVIYANDAELQELLEHLGAIEVEPGVWEIEYLDMEGTSHVTQFTTSALDDLDPDSDISGDIVLCNNRKCQKWSKNTCQSVNGQHYKLCRDRDMCVETFVKSWCPFRFYPEEVQFYKDEGCTTKKGAKTTLRLPTKNLYLPNEPECPAQ